MATMDEYIDQLLAEIPDLPLRGVVQNILDKPIPAAVQERLPKPLAPLRSVEEYQDEILGQLTKKDAKTGQLAFRQAPWTLRGLLRG